MKNPKWEGFKEASRLLTFFAISWIIGETLKQANVVPDVYSLKVLVFTYVIPVRAIFTIALTAAGRYADKYVYALNKLKGYAIGQDGKTPKLGILPW